MSSKNIKKNYIYNVCYQILALLAPLITTPYISRTLGADGIGTVSYAESIVSYFVLFGTLGITTYGQREISYVQDSVVKRSIVFWNTKILEVCTSTIALVLYICFSTKNSAGSIFLVLSFNILAVFADVTWFFQGLEEFGKIVMRNFAYKIISIIYIFTVIRQPDDVVKYAFGLAFFTFVSNVSLWSYLPKYITKIPKSQIHPFANLGTVLTLFLPTIAIQIYTVLDKTMIGVITNSSFENGYYELAIRISKMALSIVTALGVVVIPRIGYHFEKQNIQEVKRLMYRGYHFVWFLGIPLTIGLICVSENFVPWFFGGGFDKAIFLIKILSFLVLAIGINNVTGMQYLIPTKRQNIFTLTVIIGACTNFLLNAILIPLIQSTGAAIASVVAETTIAVIQLIIVRKELSPRRVLREGIHYYIAGVVMAVGLLFLSKALTPSILHTVILVICGAVFYFVPLLLIRDEFLFSNINSVVGRFRRRG